MPSEGGLEGKRTLREQRSELASSQDTRLSKWHHFRGAVLLCLMLVCLVALSVRLVDLQILQHDYYSDIADRQQTMKRRIVAQRGTIYDRKGRTLCVSVPVDSVYLVPLEMPREHLFSVSTVLSHILKLDAVALRREMLKRRDKQFMWVKRKVSKQEVETVRNLKLSYVGFRSERVRDYPEGKLAVHVIGSTNIDHKGIEGIERTLDKHLSGEDGFQQLECDGRRRPILTDRAEFKPVVHGRDVRLTIDGEIQRIVENELRLACEKRNPVSATIIVMEVKSGRVLALANFPTFDPAKASEDDAKGRLNRAVSACYEPGSVFKPFVMAAYIEDGLGRLEDQIFCENGLFRIGRRRLRDHHAYGWLPLSEVIERSSNIGMAKIGLALGKARLFSIVTAFGFGNSTGSGLPGEISGIITPFRKWIDYTVTSVPMGQEIATTPMQLITAFNALANDGTLVKPKIIESITDRDGRVRFKLENPEVGRRVVSIEAARTVVNPMMTDVVAGEDGTGRQAAGGIYSKFGKTGTGQKVVNGEYSNYRFVSSFLCGAPVSEPRISVLVLMDDPRRGNSYYGGTVAAPVAGRIVERTLRYLRVPPDMLASGRPGPVSN